MHGVQFIRCLPYALGLFIALQQAHKRINNEAGALRIIIVVQKLLEVFVHWVSTKSTLVCFVVHCVFGLFQDLPQSPNQTCIQSPFFLVVVFYEEENLVTALVPSLTACLASSPGSIKRTAVWISRLDRVAFLL
jgi:hypothetical protein